MTYYHTIYILALRHEHGMCVTELSFGMALTIGAQSIYAKNYIRQNKTRNLILRLIDERMQS